jgi:hypothetical protein
MDLAVEELLISFSQELYDMITPISLPHNPSSSLTSSREISENVGNITASVTANSTSLSSLSSQITSNTKQHKTNK